MPPEGLGVRLASAGPFSMARQVVGPLRSAVLALLPVLVAACGSPPAAGAEAPDRSSPAQQPASGVSTTDDPALPPPITAPAPGDGTPASPAASTQVVQLSPSLRVDTLKGVVEADGTLCLDAGYLEQVACRKGTREHESLIVPDAMPSAIHAALLLAGFTPGHPGRWTMDAQGALTQVPPAGDELVVELRIGSDPPRPVRDFIRNGRTGEPFPEGSFVFAGSELRERPPSLGPGELYLADWSGSVVGLVTFGDEVVAWREVIPDSAEISEPVWVTRSSELPPPGTRATLILRRAGGAAPR